MLYGENTGDKPETKAHRPEQAGSGTEGAERQDPFSLEYGARAKHRALFFYLRSCKL